MLQRLQKNAAPRKYEYMPIYNSWPMIYNFRMQRDIDYINRRFNLSPFQVYVITRNGYKYNMDKIRRVGDAIYAPYRCGIPRSIRDALEKIIFGPRADLIGADRMIASDTRRMGRRRFADY
jgi:hypothetical protein